MPRLNDQFMEALTEPGGNLKVKPLGLYYLAEHEKDGLKVAVGFNPWMEPTVDIYGVLEAHLVKGSVELSDEHTALKDSDFGLHQKGLHVGIEDAFGDRKYWITDSVDENVQVAYWDPNANTPNPQDGTPGGQYGDYAPVPQEDAEIVKEIARGVIEVARIAVESQLAA